MALKPIDHYSLTTPASVYDEEALTALELAGRTAAKVNECVENYNIFEKDTLTHLNVQDKLIETRLNEQDSKIKTAVDGIPSGIKTEVDKHIADGSFDEAINTYAGDLKAQLGNILENSPNIDGAMSAEVVDARLGKDETVYPTLRDSIQGQISQGIADTNVLDNVNRFNPDTVTANTILNSTTGELKSDTEYSTSDFIPVKAGEVLHYSANLFTVAMRYIVYYTANKTYLSYVAIVNKTTIPEGAAYMRVSFANDINPNEIMITRPYYGNTFVKSGDEIKYNVPDSSIYKVAYTNRYNPAKRINNAYVSNLDGRVYEPVEGADFVVSDLIPISKGETLKMVYPDVEGNANIRFCAGYDENFNFVGGAENVTSVTQSTGIKYIRFTVDALFANTAMICEEAQNIYLPHGEYVLKRKDEPVKQLESILGGGCIRENLDSLDAGVTHTVSLFPSHIKKNVSVSFYGSFSTYTSLKIGHGYIDRTYGALYLEIREGTVRVQRYYNSESAITVMPHGLTLSKFIHVLINYDNAGMLSFTITTETGSYSYGCDVKGEFSGVLSVTPSQYMSNVTITSACSDFSKPLWMIGDSYFGFSNDRVMGQLKELGYNDFLCMGSAGLTSRAAINHVITALDYGTPKYLVWYLGMNDGADASAYTPYMEQLKAICEARNITLILNAVPSVPNIEKKAIFSAVLSSGCRYIDSFNAVLTSSTDSWIAGTLSDDNVHPTEHGAHLLALQMLHDVPEIMTYKTEVV